jgi:hypothetical protein
LFENCIWNGRDTLAAPMSYPDLGWLGVLYERVDWFGFAYAECLMGVC